MKKTRTKILNPKYTLVTTYPKYIIKEDITKYVP